MTEKREFKSGNIRSFDALSLLRSLLCSTYSFHFACLLIPLNRDPSRLRDYSLRLLSQLVQQIMRSSNCRMACKWNLGGMSEYVNAHFSEGRVRSWKMQKHDLGKIEFRGNGLFLLLCEIWFLGRGHAYNGYRVPRVAFCCECVEGGEGESHFERFGRCG